MIEKVFLENKKTEQIIGTIPYGSTERDEVWHTIFIKVAKLIASGSHCVSKKVGCLIVRNKRIISTGINGTPEGSTNCDDMFNPSNFNRIEHHEWSRIHELHSEINSLMIAAKEGVSVKGCDMYLTLSPCIDCAKAMVAAGIKNVYFNEMYDLETSGIRFLIDSGVNVFKISF